MPLALAVLMVVFPLFGDTLGLSFPLLRHCLAHGPVRRKRSTTGLSHWPSRSAKTSWHGTLVAAPPKFAIMNSITVFPIRIRF
jgi:hypothetical protein